MKLSFNNSNLRKFRVMLDIKVISMKENINYLLIITILCNLIFVSCTEKANHKRLNFLCHPLPGQSVSRTY